MLQDQLDTDLLRKVNLCLKQQLAKLVKILKEEMAYKAEEISRPITLHIIIIYY